MTLDTKHRHVNGRSLCYRRSGKNVNDDADDSGGGGGGILSSRLIAIKHKETKGPATGQRNLSSTRFLSLRGLLMLALTLYGLYLMMMFCSVRIRLRS